MKVATEDATGADDGGACEVEAAFARKAGSWELGLESR